MRIDLIDVTTGEGGHALPATSLSVESGAVTIVEAETAQRPTLLALLASGRMRSEAGSVTLDAVASADALRAAVAVVDAPDISEPAGNLRLLGVVQEELVFAGLPASRQAARMVLGEFGAVEYARAAVETLPVALRLRVLAGLAAARPGVEALVLTSPDRHGGDPLEWYPVAEELAGRGLAVLVIAGAASVRLLKASILEAALLNAMSTEPMSTEPMSTEPPPERGATGAAEPVPELSGGLCGPGEPMGAAEADEPGESDEPDEPAEADEAQEVAVPDPPEVHHKHGRATDGQNTGTETESLA